MNKNYTAFENEYMPIDLCACYEPFEEPPADLLEEWAREAEKYNPFIGTVERKIGNTWYTVETVCDGQEHLIDKVKRLMFADKEVA